MRLPSLLRLVVRNFVSNLDPLAMVIRFGQPAFLVVVLGTMFSALVPPGTVAAGSYMAFLVPGAIAFQMVAGGVIAGNLFWLDRRWSMVEQIFVGPFRRAEYLAALVLTALLFSLVGVGLMILVAIPFIHLPALTALDLAVILLTIAMGGLFFATFLIAIGTRLRSANAYFTIQSFIQLFLVFLSTVYYPVSAKTPRLLADVLYANPLTYAANAVRDAFLNRLGTTDVLALGILSGLSLVTFALAAWGFRTMDPGAVQ